jgi:hypothetical protein
LSAAEDADDAAAGDGDGAGVKKAPSARCRTGLIVGLAVWSSGWRGGDHFGGDLGDGDAGGELVDEGLVRGERGDEGLESEVVDLTARG